MIKENKTLEKAKRSEPIVQTGGDGIMVLLQISVEYHLEAKNYLIITHFQYRFRWLLPPG